MIILGIVSARRDVLCLATKPQSRRPCGYFIVGATAYMTFLMSAQLPFGFRGDLNHMEVLEGASRHSLSRLPPPKLSGPIIGCLGQWFLVVVGILGAPSQSVILLSGAAFYIPYNLLLFGITNLLCCSFPFDWPARARTLR